jgi:hypothetical protein
MMRATMMRMSKMRVRISRLMRMRMLKMRRVVRHVYLMRRIVHNSTEDLEFRKGAGVFNLRVGLRHCDIGRSS